MQVVENLFGCELLPGRVRMKQKQAAMCRKTKGTRLSQAARKRSRRLSEPLRRVPEVDPKRKERDSKQIGTKNKTKEQIKRK